MSNFRVSPPAASTNITLLCVHTATHAESQTSLTLRNGTCMQRQPTNLYDVRLQVLTVVIAKIPCDVCCFDVSEKRTASIFRVTKLFQRLPEKKFGYPEDRSSTFLRNVGTNKTHAIWRTTPKTVISEITK